MLTIALIVDALVLHLEKEIAGAEDVAIGRGGLHRLGVLLGADAGRDLALEAAAEADESGRMRREQVLVDARLVVEALGVAGRDELDQVVIALAGRGEEHEVVGGFPRRPALRAPVTRSHIDFAAENRVDATLARLVVKDDRREHVAVLGDRHRRHLQLDRFVEQLLDPAGAVEQRVFRVQVQMDEVGHWQC